MNRGIYKEGQLSGFFSDVFVFIVEFRLPIGFGASDARWRPVGSSLGQQIDVPPLG
jgi:hypothetical protein